MNILPVAVHESGPLTFTCIGDGCGKRFSQREAKVYADLDGPPFQAYYCEKCVEKRKAAQNWAQRRIPEVRA